eukprot:Skav224853  [mRNA]  locus=scaffold322:105293:113253:+ [translate_table: standard]
MTKSGYKIRELEIQSEKSLYSVLEPRFHQLVPEWMKIASDSEKRGVLKLARIKHFSEAPPRTAEPKMLKTRSLPSLQPCPRNTVATNFIRRNMMFKIPSELEFQTERALYEILQPRYHYLVPEWVKISSDVEKPAVIKFARIAEPKLLKTIGRPRSDGFEPMLKEHPWFHKRGNPVFEPRVDVIEKFPVDASEYKVPSWMNDDLYEAEQIPKPGGCILKLKDSINIMRQKNWTRNQGTYKMFGGLFDGTTTTGSCYTREAIGLEKKAEPVE